MEDKPLNMSYQILKFMSVYLYAYEGFLCIIYFTNTHLKYNLFEINYSLLKCIILQSWLATTL